MPHLKYVGPADVRTISANDFKRVGADDQKQVHIDFRKDGENGVVEVSEKAKAYLLDKEPTAWAEPKEGETPLPSDEPEAEAGKK